MRRLIPRLPLAGLLAVSAFMVLAVSLLSPSKAEAGGEWWPPGCYVPVSGDTPSGVTVYKWKNPCGPTTETVSYVSGGGFSSGVGVMTINGYISDNGTTYSGCYQSSAPTMGSIQNGYWIPSGSIVVGLRDCLTGVTLTAPPGWTWPIWPQPVPQPQQCGSWNNWCSSPIPAPSYAQVSGCLNTGNIATYVGGDYRYWSQISWSNGTGLKYSGPAANMIGPSQGRVDVNTHPWNIRNGQVAYSVTEATYWCKG